MANPGKAGASRGILRVGDRRWKTKEYCAWGNAKARCYNPRATGYAQYGGRGIVVAPEWREDFARFLSDMGLCPPGHSLDRIDTNGPYASWNCRWATRRQQSRNTNRNRLIDFNGATLCMADWAQRIGLSRHALRSRLKRGWSEERALTESRWESSRVPPHHQEVPK